MGLLLPQLKTAQIKIKKTAFHNKLGIIIFLFYFYIKQPVMSNPTLTLEAQRSAIIHNFVITIICGIFH